MKSYSAPTGAAQGNFYLTALFSTLILLSCSYLTHAATTVTVTGSPGVGQGLANYYHTQPGDTVSLSTTTVKAPNGAVAAICTWTITLGAGGPNTYRDPNTGATVQLPPGSVLIADPPLTVPPAGGARFRICEPINTPQVKTTLYVRPPAGAIINIGGNVTTDVGAAANPQGVFQGIDSYLASLNPPTVDVLAGDLPLSVFFYPLSFDTSATAQSLTQEILSLEGIVSNTEDFAVSVTSFFDEAGNRSATYSFSSVPERAETGVLLVISVFGLLCYGWRHRQAIPIAGVTH